MTAGSKEFYEVLDTFEMTANHMVRGRLDRVKDKEWWSRGQVYENGEVNELFKLFRAGYSAGKLAERMFV